MRGEHYVASRSIGPGAVASPRIEAMDDVHAVPVGPPARDYSMLRKCVLCGAKTSGEVLVDLENPTFVPCCWGCYNNEVYCWLDYGRLARSVRAAIRGKR